MIEYLNIFFWVWTWSGAVAYLSLNVFCSPAKVTELSCGLITLACGPGAWLWVAACLHNEKMKDGIKSEELENVDIISIINEGYKEGRSTRIDKSNWNTK